MDHALLSYMCIGIDAHCNLGRHEAYYRARSKMDITVPASSILEGAVGEAATLSFEKDELVNIEYSYKVSATFPRLDRPAN